MEQPLAEPEVTGVEVVATWMEYRPAARVVNLPAALSGSVPGPVPTLQPERQEGYARALERITGYVTQRGADADGLRMVPPA